MSDKINLDGPIKFKTYTIVSEAVERGVNWGWLHAHKHTSKPSEAYIKEHIAADVMNTLCEILDFDSHGS